jgi:hypothetical protein
MRQSAGTAVNSLQSNGHLLMGLWRTPKGTSRHLPQKNMLRVWFFAFGVINWAPLCIATENVSQKVRPLRKAHASMLQRDSSHEALASLDFASAQKEALASVEKGWPDYRRLYGYEGWYNLAGKNGDQAYNNPLVYSYKNPNIQMAAGFEVQSPDFGEAMKGGSSWDPKFTGEDTASWNGDKWAWELNPAPAPPPGPTPAYGEPREVANPPHTVNLDCAGLFNDMKADYPDTPPLNCHTFSYYVGAASWSPPTGCECYAWSMNCPYETCTSSASWEGKYCLDPKAQKYGFTGLSKWAFPLNGAYLPHGGYSHHPGNMALCMYWTPKPANPSVLKHPPIDPAKWKRETTVLVFQGILLANCYKAFDAGTYEQSRKMLLKKLGVKLDILYMICGEGGASPEWKFLQLGHQEKTIHLGGGAVHKAHDRGSNVTSFVERSSQGFLQRDMRALPCVDDPTAAGCPTKPPIMFPFTPTATLSVEVFGYNEEILKATQEAGKADFCFDAANDVTVCTEWKSGDKCCPVAPPTEAPPETFTPPPYNPR